MNISFVEIQNFRKLNSIRIDFTETTTLFVGANNSGKTSAMIALRLFLINQSKFTSTDFTISNWKKINEIGVDWERAKTVPDFKASFKDKWEPLLPSLDIWISAKTNEIHYISHILPTLDWAGEPIGIRLLFEPKNLEDLYKEYIASRSMSASTIEKANSTNKQKTSGPYSVPLWPSNLYDFLSHHNRLNAEFAVNGYMLDYKKISDPVNGIAKPQTLLAGVDNLGKNPLNDLIQIDAIEAQRGFSDLGGKSSNENSDDEEERDNIKSRKLSEQLSRYYTRHINPSELPDPSDIEALDSIYKAQNNFNKKLEEGFSVPFHELEGIGYPGLTDPKLSISTKVEPIEGLRHSSAVQYDVIASDEAEKSDATRLPEQSNGLGYQNLISIIFRLISFRDNWIQIGKVGKRSEIKVDETKPHPPLHLVLVEEPEAHLHAQVQQVFIRKAYAVLRNRPELKDNPAFVTQLVISTHSSHIVYECDFASLRYFRRLPAVEKDDAPKSVVVNLSYIFGNKNTTDKFETRYIRTTHCDLFFADAVIIVEGTAEMMLMPHFIRENYDKSPHTLYQRYISTLEIGGSHAHRLRPLIEALALPTLIVTDIDSGLKPDAKTKVSGCFPARNKSMVTMNNTLKQWIPMQTDLDVLLNLDGNQKISIIDNFSSIRIAYQTGIKAQLTNNAQGEVEALAYTFEDSLALENLEIFKTIKGNGLVAKFSESITAASDVTNLVSRFHDDIESCRSGAKAQFALDVIFEISPAKLKIPTYIREGLDWLEQELTKRDENALAHVADKNVIKPDTH
jgi:predicted ATP-dependent endonuclease of OLD family